MLIDRTRPVPTARGTTSSPTRPAGSLPFSVTADGRTLSPGSTGRQVRAVEHPILRASTERHQRPVAMDCFDRAGNPGRRPRTARHVRQRPPKTSTAPRPRARRRAGWYTHAVTYAFSGTDPAPGSGMGPCDTVTYTGPDTPAASVTGGCSDNAGNRTEASDAFHYDATKPTVTGRRRPRARPQRLVHASGRVQLPGQRPHVRDRLLQLAHLLRPGRRHGPARRELHRRRRQRGDQDDLVQVRLLASGEVEAVRGAGQQDDRRELGSSERRRQLRLDPAPAGGPAVTIYTGQRPRLRGPGPRNGRKYTYAITSLDAAGNQSAPVAISAVPDGSTLRPFLDTEVSQPPTLSWAKARKAHYYNLQLYRGRTKVLSVWPDELARAARSQSGASTGTSTP